QPQLVGALAPHRMGSVSAIATVPGHIPYVVAAGVFVSQALVPAPGRILPLRLRRQTEAPSRQCVQSADKLLHLFPAYIIHREVIPLSRQRTFRNGFVPLLP